MYQFEYAFLLSKRDVFVRSLHEHLQYFFSVFQANTKFFCFFHVLLLLLLLLSFIINSSIVISIMAGVVVENRCCFF